MRAKSIPYVRRLPLRELFVALSFLTLWNAADAQPRQSKAGYEKAFRALSTAPYLALFTVIDQRSGQTVTGCNEAPFLLGALQFEHFGKIGAHDEAIEIVLKRTDRTFKLSDERALANVLPLHEAEACAEVARGRDVRRGDVYYHIILEPMHELAQPAWSPCPSLGYPFDTVPSYEATVLSVLTGPSGTMPSSPFRCGFGEPTPKETWLPSGRRTMRHPNVRLRHDRP